jgi:hypothetical protein
MIEQTTHIERVVLAFRGDADGAYKGGHVERFTVIRQDGVEIARQPGRATTIGEAAGFTWPEVAAEINAGLLIANEEQGAQITALTAEKASADAARDAALSQLETLRAKLADYEAPTDTNGVPSWVYKSQAYKALIVAGKMDYLTNALTAAAAQSIGGKLAKVDFETSARFKRDHPTVLMFISSGLFTSAEVDALFKLAATFPT